MARLLALLPLLIAACDRLTGPPGPPASPPSAAPAAAPVEVRTAAVVRGSAPRTLEATGTLHGAEETTVAAKVAGRIVGITADLGDVVAAGSPLARLDSTDYALALETARRTLRQSLARLGLETLPPGPFDASKVPAVERARLEETLARSRYDRIANLDSAVTADERDQLKIASDIAAAGHRVALLAAQAQLAEARTLEAEISVAEQKVADTVVPVPEGTLPGDGEAGAPRAFAVAARLVSVGDYVQPGRELFRLVVPNPLELRVRVPARRSGALRGGDRVTVRVDGVAEAREGRVSRIAPAVDPRTRTLEVEIRVPNEDRLFRPGAFAVAEIDLGVDEGVLFAPAAAVTAFAGVRKVFIVADGKAAERRITPGRRVGDLVEILEGLVDGDRVILDPPPGLVPGAPAREMRGDSGGAGAEAR